MNLMHKIISILTEDTDKKIAEFNNDQLGIKRYQTEIQTFYSKYGQHK